MNSKLERDLLKKTEKGLLKKNRPFNIFKTETIQEKKARELRELIHLNKINYNSIESSISNNDLGASTLLKSFYDFNVFTAINKNIVYNFNNNKIKLIKNIENILNDAFYSMKSLISRPVFEISAKKIIIHLFFFLKNYRRKINKKNRNNYIRRNFNKFNSKKNINKDKLFKKLNFKFKRHYDRYTFFNKFDKLLKFLAQILSKYLKKTVEFDLIRIHYPINDSHILAKSIGILGNKIRRRFKYFVNSSFKSANINNPSNFNLKKKMNKSLLHNASSSITGIKMKLGGRLLAQKIVPRFTSQTFQEGSLTRSNASIVTSSRFTQKNRKGTYSITVSIGHRFF